MQKTSKIKRAFASMKRVRQRTSSHCGPAVLEMLLSYLDIYIDQDVFVEVTGVAEKLQKHGMTVSELGQAIKGVVPQVQFWYKSKASFEEVNVLIHEHKFPVGVEWQGIFGKYGDDDDGHYGIITGINLTKQKLTMADPFWKFIKTDRKFTFKTFWPRWWDLNEIVSSKTKRKRHVRDKQMLFIITPKGTKFPKALKMHKI